MMEDSRKGTTMADESENVSEPGQSSSGSNLWAHVLSRLEPRIGRSRLHVWFKPTSFRI